MAATFFTRIKLGTIPLLCLRLYKYCMKTFIRSLSSGVGFIGYLAAIECNNALFSVINLFLIPSVAPELSLCHFETRNGLVEKGGVLAFELCVF